ncbi:mycothiol synthase [Brevibacterium ihuae]|uniref:mycothiol synthase n=1 Tax=Brevibacterium ihuae TaxID=1631743 RepID=UPI000C75A1FC|nr:mycothiol synthase [Brevibacterium ihuae]
MSAPEIQTVDHVPAQLPALLDAATRADGLLPISDGLLAALGESAEGTRMWTADTGDELLGFGVAAEQGARWAAEAVVAPDSRGTGLGGELVRAMHDELTAAGAGAWFWSHGDHPAAAHLAAALGYERERELLQLHTDPLDRLTLPEPRTPEDTTIRPFAPGDEDGWLQVNNAAFDWHPEQGGQARSDIAAIVDAPGFDPADVLIAERANAVIGFHHTKLHRDHPSGAVTGEVYVIGVDPAVHAAGVGRALTVAGMHHLRGIGAEVVELYVESDNVPARRLYESLGFTHTIVHVSYAPPGTAEEN